MTDFDIWGHSRNCHGVLPIYKRETTSMASSLLSWLLKCNMDLLSEERACSYSSRREFALEGAISFLEDLTS